MVDYMEILRLSSDPKNSQRCIASIVHSSRHTIRDILEAAKKAGVSWPLDDTVTNEMLKRILFPEKTTAETLYTQPDYPYIHKELARPGVNLTLLWTEYCSSIALFQRYDPGSASCSRESRSKLAVG